jgi:hypothetical protein
MRYSQASTEKVFFDLLLSYPPPYQIVQPIPSPRFCIFCEVILYILKAKAIALSY